MKKLLFLLVFLALFSYGCATEGPSKDSLMSLKDSGRIVPVGSLSYDWADINIEGGNVSHQFKFKNGGEDDLIIKTAMTSCMCTDVVFTLADGSKSPAFGMHGASVWGGLVKPGEEFEALVTFDPMAHGPDAVGPIMRSVYLDTSSVASGDAKFDTASGKMVTELTLKGDVLKKEEFEKKKSEFGFLINESEFDFGVIKQSGGIVSHEFNLKYQGDNPLIVTGTPSSCACTEGKISSKNIKKGDEVVLTVLFDPNLHEEPEGKFFKTVTVLTDPKLEKQPEFKIWMEIDLDLGPAAFKLKEDHDDGDSHENGLAFHNISAQDLVHELENKDFFLIDVHTPEQKHIEGTDAVIPYDKIAENVSMLPKDKSKEIIVYCRSGSMSLSASQKLIDLGYKNVKNVVGGRNEYVKLTK